MPTMRPRVLQPLQHRWRFAALASGILAALLAFSPPASSQEPERRKTLNVCPCWLSPRELVKEVREMHSDIEFTCYLTSGSSSSEIAASSAGVGGPFRSFVYTAQPRAQIDSRCRHYQSKPRVNLEASEELRTAGQRAACVSIVADAARLLGCQ